MRSLIIGALGHINRGLRALYYQHLQERSLLVTLPSIPENRRVQEAAFWSEFEAARPRIFGALLEGVSAALRDADNVRLEKKPRMADFAVRATAMEAAFGWEPGSFAEVYEANRREASEALLGNEPLVDAIEALLDGSEWVGLERFWSGTATELLKTLNLYTDDAVTRTKAQPGGPQVLSKKMRRLAPALRSAGIEYLEDEQGHRKRKVKTLKRPLRDYERDEDPAEGNREDGAAADDPTPEGEERLTGNPFDFDFEGDNVGNPFAPDDNEADDPDGQGEEREHQPDVTALAGPSGHPRRRRYAGVGTIPASAPLDRSADDPRSAEKRPKHRPHRPRCHYEDESP